MEKQSLLKGAFILIIAGFINRVLGFILRIILVQMIGDEGLGLFQMVYPFFITLLLISTASFPTAISKLIPERLARNDKKRSLSITQDFITFCWRDGATYRHSFILFIWFCITEHIR